MKKLPIINFDKFEKRQGLGILPPNCEMFWYGFYTEHFYSKNYQPEGIGIKWKGNPFELNQYFDYILNK